MKQNTKIEALAKFLEVEQDDIESDGDTFTYGKQEYLVLTDAEADEKAREYIIDSVWAFNKSFLDNHSNVISKINDKAFSAIQEQCESANDAILAMIDDIDHFIEDAMTCDGRGHFLSSYDGEEQEQDEFFIYRIN